MYPSPHHQALTDALLHRINAGRYPRTAQGAAYHGRTLADMARTYLQATGHPVSGLNTVQLSERAMLGTSDFPEVLANVGTKLLRDAYEAAPRTFLPWCKRAALPNFKEVSRVQLGDAPRLVQVGEHGEYTYGTLGDTAEKYSLATYGRIVAITRQAIINDDTSAFSRLMPSFGNAAANLESDLVYAVLNSNPAMADGVDLFHEDHGNLAASGAPPSVETLGMARAAMRTQASDSGTVLNITPRYLIVPAALETLALQLTSTAAKPGEAAKVNPFAGLLVPIIEPRLDAVSPAAWYLAADPAQIDTVEYAYLEGADGVYIETRQGWAVDGVEMKARLDFACKAIDWRGLYRNPGE